MIRFGDIKRAWRIDLFEACYALSNETISVFDDKPKELLPSRDNPFSILMDMWRNFIRIASERYSKRKSPHDGELLFFAHTPNNTRALSFLQAHYGGAFFASSDFCGLVEVLLSILFLPRVLRQYGQASPLRKKSMKLYFHEYLGFYPLFLGAVSYLRKRNPPAVFFANDHAMSPRAVFYAAQYLGLPTVYIQHASITARMPQLEFGLALLDGPATLEQYEKAGPVLSEVEFVGLPRMEASGTDTVQEKTHAIGLGTTLLDKHDVVEQTVTHLRTIFPDRLFRFRYHPGESGERKRFWDELCEKLSMEKSDAGVQSVGEFLGSISLLFAGDCSIHLESALLGTPSIMMPWSGIESDRYGYVENNLVPFGGKMEGLEEVVARAVISESALSRFVAVRDPEHGRARAFLAIDHFLQLHTGDRN